MKILSQTSKILLGVVSFIILFLLNIGLLILINKFIVINNLLAIMVCVIIDYIIIGFIKKE